MSVARQMVEVVVASVLAVAGILLIAPIASASMAQTVGIIIACGYYFSRYPWGSRQPEGINDRIDALYDRILPF
ncbi:hypothetical protein [Haloarchaeobius iranensis]|uniref:Uncharacterized protein n=1 Tax=Haloarchaeobius iranensis TaxID=996166 RepID=A0A1G9XKP8_9EURY|nr:hypothetical protein [Haloarchaeobius iranensis]SDM97354.1 hypothetical protein SAMN05192554_1119 [Haloarchaeobius iranensis]